MEHKLTELENILGVTFSNKALLQEALTHRSYLNENKKWKFSHNERLEFLGDAVLELAVTHSIFIKFPKFDEGKMTSLRSALVNTQMLAKIAREIGLEKYILTSKGESEESVRAKESLLADGFEAVLGSIYLDKGFDFIVKIIEKQVLSHIEEVITNHLYENAKSEFQEYSQAFLKKTPEYKVVNEFGPDHDKKFIVAVFIGDKAIAEGKGASKQEAEQNAAEKGLHFLKKA